MRGGEQHGQSREENHSPHGKHVLQRETTDCDVHELVRLTSAGTQVEMTFLFVLIFLVLITLYFRHHLPPQLPAKYACQLVAARIPPPCCVVDAHVVKISST